MSVQDLTTDRAGAATSTGSTFRSYRLEAKYELFKMLRMPAYAVPTLAFPVLFYLLFGISFGSRYAAGAVSMSTYLLATYGAFGVIGAALFGFGVGVAVERGQGWMLLKRASPMPPLAYFAAKMAMSLLFGLLIVLALFTLGATAGGVELPAATWLALGGTLIAGSLPFCAFGLAMAHFVGPNAAPAVVNLLYLPMAFASGLWIPVTMLPAMFKSIAPWLPAYHYAQLALATIGADEGGSTAGHLVYLVVFTLACVAIAWLGYRRDGDRTYG
jgi:ABC-2 type transport system permease protein